MPNVAVEDAIGHWPFVPTGNAPYCEAENPTINDPKAGAVLVPVPPPNTGVRGAACADNAIKQNTKDKNPQNSKIDFFIYQILEINIVEVATPMPTLRVIVPTVDETVPEAFAR